jgi:hypothetical protein
MDNDRSFGFISLVRYMQFEGDILSLPKANGYINYLNLPVFSLESEKNVWETILKVF